MSGHLPIYSIDHILIFPIQLNLTKKFNIEQSIQPTQQFKLSHTIQQADYTTQIINNLETLHLFSLT